ncbi:MAG: C1 family peptidase [Syntrophales bacterium]|nr:C1 family peptidase [Syntrophales bacterium]MDD5642347.1 C1 family peptidase [Syntrophales bacterium]
MLSGRKIRNKWVWGLASVFIFLLIGLQVYAAEIDLVQQAISTRRAKWVAKENPVSQLPPEVRKKLLGAPDQPLDTGAPLLAPYGAEVGALPASFDWRSAAGGNFVTPVRDQKTCGSCWAFSTTAALESKCLITFNWPGKDLDLSEQIVLSCSGGGTCGGGQASVASEYLISSGTTFDSCYPYTGSNGVCSNACSNWQKRAYKIDSWQYVSYDGSATAATIKNAIYNNGPVVAWFKVYTDFYYYDSGVYSYSYGDYEGNHFVLVTGWDDSQSAFIVKNSWNTTWGTAGYFKIAYIELTGTSLFGSYTYGYGKAISPKTASSWLELLLM